MRHHRPRSLALLGIVAMLSGACSTAAPGGTPGATGSGATAPSPVASTAGPVAPRAGASEACGLITPQEAASATGVGVSAANGTTAGPSSSCIYLGEGGASLVISTTLQVGTAGIDQYLNDPANEQVAGIGDKAVIFRAGGAGVPTGRTIYVRKSDKAFVINVHVEKLDDPKAKTILVQLATIAVGRA